MTAVISAPATPSFSGSSAPDVDASLPENGGDGFRRELDRAVERSAPRRDGDRRTDASDRTATDAEPAEDTTDAAADASAEETDAAEASAAPVTDLAAEAPPAPVVAAPAPIVVDPTATDATSPGELSATTAVDAAAPAATTGPVAEASPAASTAATGTDAAPTTDLLDASGNDAPTAGAARPGGDGTQPTTGGDGRSAAPTVEAATPRTPTTESAATTAGAEVEGTQLPGADETADAAPSPVSGSSAGVEGASRSAEAVAPLHAPTAAPEPPTPAAVRHAEPTPGSQAVPDPVADAAEQVLRTEELAESLRASFRRGETTNSLTMQLHPAELGAVRIEARLVDGVTHLVLRAEHGAALERLGSALDQLRQDLAGKGVDVGDLELRQGGTQSGDGRDHGERATAGSGARSATSTSNGATADRTPDRHHDLRPGAGSLALDL